MDQPNEPTMNQFHNPIKHRFFFKFCFFLIFILGTLVSQAQERPNILWLVSEDNHINWVGCYGNPQVETPNIDKMASEGFRYTHAYANAPVCAPSRSTWITGINALSMGTHPMRSRNEIPHDLIKYYPDLLKGAGYTVANGRKTDYNIGGREDADCWDSNTPILDQLPQKQPFFQIVNLFESHESRVHGDVENTKHNPANTTLRAYHPDLPDVRKTYAKYHDAVKRMDSIMGDVLNQLEELGLAENTIVIYNSDHGGVLARSKRYLFDSGIHCPLVVRIPEKYKHLYPAKATGSVVDRIVSFVDMPKTWLSLTGVDIPDYMQGTIFLGDQMEPEKEYHFAFRGRMDERFENARAVYDKDFVYIRNYMPYVQWMQPLSYLWKAKATEAWDNYVNEGKGTEAQRKFFFPKMFSEELYDLKNDPDNVNNLIGDKQYSKRVKSMSAALRNWQIEINDSGLLPEAEMVKRAKDADLTIYEMVRNPNLYDLPSLLDAADLAMEQDKQNASKLRSLLQNKDSGIRYWGIVGLFLINESEGVLPLLKDKSHEVRAMAAWLLIKSKKNQQDAYDCIIDLIQSKSYATLKLLNITDWMEEDGEVLIPIIKSMDFSHTNNESYVLRARDYLIAK
jgi:arylsulfatase A-like enzyme